MNKFSTFLIESKNTHMEHIEELIFNEGVTGTRKAINFVRDIRDAQERRKTIIISALAIAGLCIFIYYELKILKII